MPQTLRSDLEEAVKEEEEGTGWGGKARRFMDRLQEKFNPTDNKVKKHLEKAGVSRKKRRKPTEQEAAGLE